MGCLAQVCLFVFYWGMMFVLGLVARATYAPNFTPSEHALGTLGVGLVIIYIIGVIFLAILMRREES